MLTVSYTFPDGRRTVVCATEVTAKYLSNSGQIERLDVKRKSGGDFYIEHESKVYVMNETGNTIYSWFISKPNKSEAKDGKSVSGGTV